MERTKAGETEGKCRARSRAKRGFNEQSMMRICRDALTPDTAKPSFRNRSFNCGFVRVFMSAVRCGTSDAWPEVAIAVRTGG